MQTNSNIQFKKQRELGDILTVTFKFIRENYKPLLKLMTSITGPYFLILLAAISYYTYAVAGSPFQAISSGFTNFLFAFLILAAALLLFYAALYGTILHYIKSYTLHNGEVKPKDVKQGVQQDFFKLILLSIISAILIIAGLIVFIIPGIYLIVPLSFASAVLVFKRYSVTESIGYCFELIKDHWWMTFITLLVVWLLVYIIGLVFQMPMLIYMFIKAFTMVQEGSAANPEAFMDWPFMVLNVISSLIQYLLSTITIIAITFIYFNLNEHKNLTGTFETIDNLGNH
ncbi:hypothetical protein FHG64_18330 [Antarcticibacterium flavum]|uniref:Glycerophosphoryl diester phosphodiesterase membrane domain-containing protein n=1 Tax=Antarcticibacterium flavum TaxID=2058175 RepID=A0A5B7X9A5_9FLAO|nr:MULTISPECIES: hypothetical protein [Antarcticibacterium]MCM4160661.1 hypothetical protein [Antarcticibacterium sp. W02-3]QCY71191.1 hypothetical protein FHG64_18330 [Antarcticibacterium flavum]